MTDPKAPTAGATEGSEADEVVHLRVERGIATITLDSPANRNALSAALVTQLAAHLAAAVADDAARAVVLAHTGTTFCAGADLAEAAREGGPGKGTARLVDLLRSILEAPVPVVGRIDGHVRAGGMGLVGACDVVIAGPSSTFALTEARLGLSPAMISLTVLPRLTDRAASRTFLTGETFGPAEAVAIGLITEAADDGAGLDAALDRYAEAFRRSSPQGLAESKALTTRAMLRAFDRDADELAATSARLFASDEAQEGIASFMEKRPPRWAID
ncbi:MAG: enoyl-CoA hydratase family protein [Acidimicrobiales bacterium]|nr:enoyl-CoA hydratase family protein [Acidimicrobiales bacterium]